MIRRVFLTLFLVAVGFMPSAVADRAAETSDEIPRVDLFESLGNTSEGHPRFAVHPAALAIVKATRPTVDLPIPLGSSEHITLRVSPFDVVTPQTRFIRATRHGTSRLENPNIILLRGEVSGEPGSRVFLALDDSGTGSGSIIRANGTQYRVSTRRATTGTELIVHPDGSELPEVDELCRVIPTGIGGGTDGGSPQEELRGVRVLNIAVDTDHRFRQLFISDTEALAYIVQLVGAVSDIYIRDLNLKLVLDFARLWPDGGEPFDADNLSGFRGYWIEHEDTTGLNLVHLFSGRRNLPYGGVAYLANGCSDFAYGISGFLNGNIPQPVTHAAWGNWDVIVVAHEIGHNLSTPHTHDYAPPIDQCTSGVEERGTIMSYCHTRAGGLRNIDAHMHIRVASQIRSNNPLGNCLWHDCNGNGINDAQDIAQGQSFDFNANGVPDSCEDCNTNGILDSFEIDFELVQDINLNGLPDICELDCNRNGVPDTREIGVQPSLDQNGNGLLDTCDPDCDNNGVADHIDIRIGTHADLDRNRLPDVCQDCDDNGNPDWLDVDRQFNFFVGQASGAIREYHAASGVFIRELGTGVVNGAYDLVFGPDRQLYVTSFNDHRIVRIDVDTGVSSVFVAGGSGGLANPAGLHFGPDGHLYTASQGTNSVIRFNGATGALLGTFVSPGSGGLVTPWDVLFGPNGNLFVISSDNRILEYHGLTGAFIGAFATIQLNDPRGMTFLSNGHLLVTNRGSNQITRYNTNGSFVGQFNDEYPVTDLWSIGLSRDGDVLAARNAGSDVRIVEFNAVTGRYYRAVIRGDGLLTDPTSIVLRPSSPNDRNGNDLPDVCDPPACAADIAPPLGDGNVNTADLLTVINAWGPCPGQCPPRCTADLVGAPVGGDCVVGVSDLLALINSWGPCTQ